MLASNECHSPLFKSVVASGVFGKSGMVTDFGLHMPETWSATNERSDHLSNIDGVDPYVRSPETPEFAFDVVPIAEYPAMKVGSGEVGPIRKNASELGGQGLPRYDESFRADPNFVLRAENFAKGSGDPAAAPLYGSRPEVLDLGRVTALNGYRENLSRASSNSSVLTKGGAVSLRTSRSKLRWQPRDFEDEDAPAAAAAPTTAEENVLEGGHTMRTGRGLEPFQAGFPMERNAGASNYSGRQDREERTSFADRYGLGQQRPRSPSEESDRTTSDVYNHPVSVGDYDLSETSSTTAEEIDDGVVTSRSVGRASPQSESGIPRHVPRPHIRSNASTGTYHSAKSSMSDDYYYLQQMEMVASPDVHPQNGRLFSLRTQSWDERLDPPGTSASVGSVGGVADRALSVRHRPPSSEHGPRESLVRVSSDPSAGCRMINRGYHVHDTAKQPLPSNFRHQQWQAPPPYASSRGAPFSHRSPKSLFGERPQVQYLQSGPTYQFRPSHRLPPRPGQCPPLPPRGVLQRVDCQHCDIQLLVPSKLPPNSTNIQKLRCGSCKRVSQFSVMYGDDSVELPFSSPDSHHSCH